jgi:hypothetical protein
MSDAQFDAKVFSRHVKKIHDGWKVCCGKIRSAETWPLGEKILPNITCHFLTSLPRSCLTCTLHYCNGRITDCLFTQDGAWNGLEVGALAFIWGKGEDEGLSNKTVALHSYLFQYELPETLLVFTKSQLFMVSGKKKSSFDSVHSITMLLLTHWTCVPQLT